MAAPTAAKRPPKEQIERAEALSDRTVQVTSAVYQMLAPNEPSLVGSGVLIEMGGMRFFLTAGHVLDMQRESPLWVGASPALIPLDGDVTRVSSAKATSARDDKLDLGLVRLTGAEWQSANPSAFAQWHELDIPAAPLERHAFGIVGYACSQNRHKPQGTALPAFAYRMAGLECKEAVYDETDHSPALNLLVGYDPKTMWSIEGMRTAPDLYGVSGGGFWRFGPKMREADAPPLLAAIGTEFHPKGRHRYVLGTRIGVAVHALATQYSDVNAFVESQLPTDA